MTQYLQVSLNVDLDQSDQVIGALTELGALSVSIYSADNEDTFDEGLPRDPEWMHQKLVALFSPDTTPRTLTHQLAQSLPGQTAQFSSLEDQDWERAWMEQFTPQKILPGFWVVPSWIEPPEPDAVNLVIDPGLAFGTGTHPTTRMCLQYLGEMDVTGRQVLDYGCGSGILSIAALKLGAEKVVATDIDERALVTCHDNAQLNHCAKSLVTVPTDQIASTEAGWLADIVVANILAPALLTLRETLLGWLAPQGVLLLSGILPQQADEIEAAYQEDIVFSRQEQSGWVLMVGQRNSDNHGARAEYHV